MRLGRLSRLAVLGLVLVGVVGLATGPAALGAGTPAAVHHERVPLGGSPGTADTEIDYINGVTTVALTPATPGTVEATIEFAIPDNVGEFAVQLGDIGRVEGVTGFEDAEDEWRWDGETADPQIRLTIDANRTSANAPEVVREGLTFVDTGNWAIVPVPRYGARWSYSGDTVKLATKTQTSGSGVAGSGMAYLGPATLHEHSAGGQSLRLVVPEAATMTESPAAVLDTLAWASSRLNIGGRDARVLIIAAPADIDWGLSGLQIGPSDAWVRADTRLDTTDNVWLHEYVHTRQDVTTTTASRWLAEGTANYYAALLTYESGTVDYEAFRQSLARGTEESVADAVLSDPQTWDSPFVPYEKGALVAGALDRRMRLATDGGVTLETIVDRLNRLETVRAGDLEATVRDLAGDAAADFTRRHVTTSAVPSTWSRSEHAAAFDSGADLRYRLAAGGFAVGGPYRNATLNGDMVLVPNETLTARVTVSNAGDAAGPFSATMRVNGSVVAATEGDLAAGDTSTVEVAHAFDSVGHYAVSVGETTRVLTVLPAASPTVTDRSVAPERPAPGETVELRVTLENPADRPAKRTVEFGVDGTTIATRLVRLDVGETSVVGTSTTFESAGTYTVSLAGGQLEIRVADRTSIRTSGGSTTASAPSIPGFGATLAGVALILALLVRRQRRSCG